MNPCPDKLTQRLLSLRADVLVILIGIDKDLQDISTASPGEGAERIAGIRERIAAHIDDLTQYAKRSRDSERNDVDDVTTVSTLQN